MANFSPVCRAHPRSEKLLLPRLLHGIEKSIPKILIALNLPRLIWYSDVVRLCWPDLLFQAKTLTAHKVHITPGKCISRGVSLGISNPECLVGSMSFLQSGLGQQVVLSTIKGQILDLAIFSLSKTAGLSFLSKSLCAGCSSLCFPCMSLSNSH